MSTLKLAFSHSMLSLSFGLLLEISHLEVKSTEFLQEVKLIMINVQTLYIKLKSSFSMQKDVFMIWQFLVKTFA